MMDRELRRRASKQFNALHDKTRNDALPIIIATQIQQLERELERLKHQHQESRRQIREHMSNLERSLEKALSEQETATL